MSTNRSTRTGKLIRSDEVAGIRCLEGDCGKISIKLRAHILAGTAHCDFCGTPLKIDKVDQETLSAVTKK